MIILESILIEEFRGVRRLELPFAGKNFAICGRNGTGKSGVVDAIEFVLTGNISRLSGEGTDKISVRQHAPHVDSRNNPERARVTLKLTIPSLKKTATITRVVSDPKAPRVSPADADIRSVLQQIEEHPELVLTRREIIRYVLATEGDRAEEVQAVLKLDRLEDTRSTLQTIANAASRDAKAALQNVELATQGLVRALGIAKLSEADLLAAVNTQRGLLRLPEIPALAPTTSLKEGVTVPVPTAGAGKLPKAAAVADLGELRTLLSRYADVASDAEFRKALDACTSLNEDAESIKALARQGFLESGLMFIVDNHCPFCDKDWDPKALRAHVGDKLKSLESVRKKREIAEATLAPIVAFLSQMSHAVDSVGRYYSQAVPAQPKEPLVAFKGALDAAAKTLGEFLPLPITLAVLTSPPPPAPEALESLATLERYVAALPEPSREEAAREYLIVAQEKLESYREATRVKRKADANETLAADVVSIYAKTCDAELTKLYREVEKDFATMYGELNSPDEANFDAKLLPSIGKLGFDVNFYGKGFFPPGAYHSEGHQDAMGLCLYLALMRHVLKTNFRFAVLDDVLMSVDAGHRRAVCALLKKRFKDTQFILTTHDPVWLNHMRTEGLINAGSLTYFHSWDVSTGPAFWDDTDVWDQIRMELDGDRVSVAAELLRNYLEYVAGEICQRLRARVEFRLDARMELGELLPPACERLSELYSKGKDAANSWKDAGARAALDARHDALTKARKATAIDQWQINAAVHYNSWASLHKNDFAPLVASFRTLVESFRCPNSDCQGFLQILREGVMDKSVTCACGKSGFNLQPKASK